MIFKRLFIGFLSFLLVIVGYVFSLLTGKSDLNISLWFSGISAIATAFAAIGALKSAQIAKNSSIIWKRQMRLDIELTEAKEVKIALNSLYRHIMNESERYKDEDIIRIGELQKLKNNKIHSTHFNKYVSKLTEYWLDFQKSIDGASFINSGYESTSKINVVVKSHLNSCNELILYLEGMQSDDFEKNDIYEVCSKIYIYTEGFQYSDQRRLHQEFAELYDKIDDIVQEQIDKVKDKIGKI